MQRAETGLVKTVILGSKVTDVIYEKEMPIFV